MDITVRQADKGGNIVILDSGLYKELNENMLLDNTPYRILDSDPIHFHSAAQRDC